MYIGQEIFSKIYLVSEDNKMIDVLEEKFNLKDSIMSLGSDDFEITLDEYVREMINPMEDVRVYSKITDELGGNDFEDIKIITADSVTDPDKFDSIFNELATKLCKDIGDYSIVNLNGYKVAYTYQEGGYPVLLVKM